jgi:hypothetical protein
VLLPLLLLAPILTLTLPSGAMLAKKQHSLGTLDPAA